MTTPKISELYNSIQTDLKKRLGITTIVGKVVLNAMALVQAAKLKLYYLNLAFVYKNILPDTADSEIIGGTLERYGLLKLGRSPYSATAGEYVVNVNGTIGAVIAPNTTFKSTDTSRNPDKLFVLDTTYIFSATTGQITVRALTLGTEALLEIGNQIQVTQPIANVNSFATVDSIVTTPTDAESLEAYREQVIQSYQLESQGGAKTDYRIWAADATGVRYVYPETPAPGIVNIYVEANAADSQDGNGTPTAGIIAEVEAVIEMDPDTTKPINERGRRPMGAYEINVLSITPIPINVEIVNLSDVSYISAITEAIREFLLSIRPYVAGADNPNYPNKGLLYEFDISTVIKQTIGAETTFNDIRLFVNAVQTTYYEFTVPNIPYINIVTNVAS